MESITEIKSIQQIATNIEQSKRLISCGVDPNTADMSLDIDTKILYPGRYIDRVDLKHEIPAFSLSALLALLPKSIKGEDDKDYSLNIYPWCEGWQIDYTLCVDDECHTILWPAYGNTPIEACVKAIQDIIANNYKLNEL